MFVINLMFLSLIIIYSFPLPVITKLTNKLIAQITWVTYCTCCIKLVMRAEPEGKTLNLPVYLHSNSFAWP